MVLFLVIKGCACTSRLLSATANALRSKPRRTVFGGHFDQKYNKKSVKDDLDQISGHNVDQRCRRNAHILILTQKKLERTQMDRSAKPAV